MNKFLRYSFLMLVALFCGNVSAGTIVFGELGLENGVQYADPFDGGDFTVTFAGGANDGKYYNTGSGIRVYGGGSMMIAPKSGTLTKVVITFDGANKPDAASVVDNGTYDPETGVWTGEGRQVTFVRPSGSGHWRVQKIEATVEGSTPIAVEAPKFSVPGGTYYEPQTVAMSCATEGAKILYTIPAGEDPVYTDDSNYTGVFYDGNPLTISRTTTIKAMAVKDGKTSSIVSATYTIKEIEEINVTKALEIINALDNGKTTADVYKVKGIVVGTPDFQRNADGALYGNVNFEISDGDGATTTLTVYRCKDLENQNFNEETINRFKAGDAVVIQGNLQKYVKDEVVTPEIKNCFLISVTAAGGTTTEDTWTVAGTLPIVNKEWDPSDTSADMTPNGNGVGVSSYEKDDIVLEKGTNYEFKIVKNHSWDEAYPKDNFVITVEETAKYHLKIFFNTTTHEITYEIAKTGSAGPVEHTYSVIGTLVGNWDVDTEMTKGDDGIFKAVFESVAKGNYEFKVRADKAWSVSYPSSNYKLTVEEDNSTVTVTFNEEKKEVNATVAAGAAGTALVWDFTKWGAATVRALKADAAASKLEGWSDVEKKADAEAGADPTEATKDNCFWCVAEPNADGTLSASGMVIEELKGLKFYSIYTTARSLAIAVNYPSTSLGDYAGGSYLWLGGGKKKVPCFAIPSVAAGSTITMEIESHKPSEGRGVELYAGLSEDGKTVDEATKIGDTFNPKTKEAHSWTIQTAGDVIVYNTNGCHIYTIKVEAGDPSGISVVEAQKVQNNAIYNLAGQKVGKDYKGIVIMNGRKFMQK